MILGYIDIHAAIISFLIKYNLWSEKDKKPTTLKNPWIQNQFFRITSMNFLSNLNF